MSSVEPPVDRTAPIGSDRDPDAIELPMGTKLHHAERLLIESTLRHCSGNRQRAADLLGCSLKTLYNKLQSYRSAVTDLEASSGRDASRRRPSSPQTTDGERG